MTSPGQAPDSNPATTIQSVSRASRMLLFVASSADGVAAKAVADELGLQLPTAYNLLSTLVAEGLLAKDGRRTYTLGPKAAVLVDAVARDTTAPDYYLEPLNELAQRTEETAYLSAWRQGQIRVLATVEGAHAVRVTGLTTGRGGLAHARASGKLLLAFARPEVRESVLGSGRLEKRTEHTITSRARLDEELEWIRVHGYAVDREEYADGVICISAPVVEEQTVVAAYTVSVPTVRFAGREEELRAATLEAAARASSAGSG